MAQSFTVLPRPPLLGAVASRKGRRWGLIYREQLLLVAAALVQHQGHTTNGNDGQQCNVRCIVQHNAHVRLSIIGIVESGGHVSRRLFVNLTRHSNTAKGNSVLICVLNGNDILNILTRGISSIQNNITTTYFRTIFENFVLDASRQVRKFQRTVMTQRDSIGLIQLQIGICSQRSSRSTLGFNRNIGAKSTNLRSHVQIIGINASVFGKFNRKGKILVQISKCTMDSLAQGQALRIIAILESILCFNLLVIT